MLWALQNLNIFVEGLGTIDPSVVVVASSVYLRDFIFSVEKPCVFNEYSG